MRSRPSQRVWHRLAEKLGMPVREAKQRISNDEYISWIAYYNLDIAAHSAAVNKTKGRGTPVSTPAQLESYMQQKGLA